MRKYLRSAVLAVLAAAAVFNLIGFEIPSAGSGMIATQFFNP